MQATGGKGAEGKLVRASLPGGGPIGCNTMRVSFPSRLYPGLGRHQSGPGKYGDAYRLATGKRKKTSSPTGSEKGAIPG